jgi:hypothetical protein
MKIKELIELLKRYNLNADVYAVTFNQDRNYYNFNSFHSSNGSTPKGATEVIVYIEEQKEENNF